MYSHVAFKTILVCESLFLTLPFISYWS